MNRQADWQLPPGVSPGTQEYFESQMVAEDYDEYFRYTSLFQFDQAILTEEFGKPVPGDTIADFGCGSGRALVPLVSSGYRGLAIDLSASMLDVVRRKSDEQDLGIHCVQANLVELDGFRDDSVDHGICLFSTLGMVQGKSNRQQAVSHFRRMIRPGGKLVIHVHNYLYNLFDPGGPTWMFRNLWQSWTRKGVERGDRTYPYRGVYNMFLHVFTRSEIRALLQRAGFRISRWIPLNPTRMDRLRLDWLASSLRCNGWVLVCE